MECNSHSLLLRPRAFAAAGASAHVGSEIAASPRRHLWTLGFICSGSMKGTTTSSKVRNVARGEAKIGSIFSKDQKAFLPAICSEQPENERPQPSGSHNAVEAQVQSKDAGTEDGRGALALPRRVEDPRALDQGGTVRGLRCGGRGAFVSENDHGIDLTAEQQTKTKTALKYFAAQVSSSPEQPIKS